MPEVFEELAGLARLIHEPARLAILSALSACEDANFLFLQHLTGVSKGNLSSHLSKLEEAGLVRIDKQFVGKTPTTFVKLTDAGHSAIEQHWQQLERLRTATQHWAEENKRTAPDFSQSPVIKPA
jgi:DNA-binding transcriptional ArsR family regulator